MVLRAEVNSAMKTPVNGKNIHEHQLPIGLTLPVFRNGGDQRSHRAYLIKTIRYT